ncbi:DEAD/DEAH box helicase family protein [Bradyrhizobium manausense]|uniref:ORC1/DEAH AAA+ ATPase domain-containing protein n=1 Tax=Bradyrhizobium manausense TaxID=989370 RepID=A0A0R3DXK6_9BRAD|nr:DEAD/DEAH box helicase family protein [Bradyrhizobium manausense]KRQ14673.1 hypothetical protein AOQ71_12365 [Bradyrhizobium manausense]
MDKSKKFADWKPRDRVAHLKRRMFETADSQRIDQRLFRLFDTAGTGPEGDGAFVVGETGVGKTTGVRLLTDRIYEELRAEDPSGKWSRPEIAGTDLRPILHETANGFKRPIAVVLVGKNTTFSSFLGDTADAIQVNLPVGYKFGEAQLRVNKAVKKQGIKMVIFDETQHIVEGNMNTYDAGDVFKLLIKSRVQVVCVGLTHALDLATANDQLDRLVKKKIVLEPFRCTVGDFPELDKKGNMVGDEVQEPTEFRQLMALIDYREGTDSVLPFDKPSKLSAPDMALRIHQAGGGYIGRIMPLIYEAATLAIYDGSAWITKSHFAEAYRESSRCDDKDNWFVMDFPSVMDRFGSIREKKLISTGIAKKQLERHMSKRSRRRVADVIAGRD